GQNGLSVAVAPAPAVPNWPTPLTVPRQSHLRPGAALPSSPVAGEYTLAQNLPPAEIHPLSLRAAGYRMLNVVMPLYVAQSYQCLLMSHASCCSLTRCARSQPSQ